MSRAGAALAILLALALTGCAWANRDNRPVWNAFEEHLVPEDDTWFLVALPLTVPGGFVAILLDTFIVHPASVADDAWGDASDLWRGIEWDEHYYTELAVLPLRVLATPLWFVGAFLGRSAFDIPPYEPPLTPDEERERAAALDAERSARWAEWLASLASGGHEPLRDVPAPSWSDALEEAFRDAQARATAMGRAELYATARRNALPPWLVDPWMALRDPDPVVRYLELRLLDEDDRPPDELLGALLTDESETVRLLAERLWR